MRALLAVLVIAASGCQYSPVPRSSRTTDVDVPDAVTPTSHSLDIRLEPTVMLWARDGDVDLEALMDASLTKIQRDLEAPAVSVAIQAGSVRTIPDVGIGGVTDPSTGQIKITMDHRSPVGPRRLLTVWLPLALAHELHHTKRVLDGPGYGTTLLEAMVTEGTAEVFVRETFPDAPSIPWVRPLGASEERKVWERARREGDDPDDGVQHDWWFFGGRGLPRWAGYKIGYAIVNAYLDRHPDSTAAELAMTSAEQIVSGSRYDP